MSWALEEWKEGLPSRALQKVQELEGQLDRLKKDRQQKQFQLDSLEAALQKQKQKVESEKNESVNLKRENQSLAEACEGLERTKQKMAHELQLKESQLSFQEGQLSSSRKQIERLEQELKRYRSELERNQASATPNPGVTPKKDILAPSTPAHSIDSRYEELKEKYSWEVEERKRLETELKAWKAKRPSPHRAQGTMNHRDIARHQTSSTVFSWEQDRTPSCVHSNAQRTPGRRDLWAVGDQEQTPSRWQPARRDTNCSFGDSSGGSHLLDQLQAQNQELRSQASELEQRLQGQERELRSQGDRIQEMQLQRDRARGELAERDKALSKSGDELARVCAQYEQASAKCSELEQKLKKLAEDLSCQRQNAESARRSWEQKSREKEKELQEELSRQQRALQSLEQESVQTKGKLSQELQKAKNHCNSLQAELDKVASGKLQVDRNLEELKQKLCRAEQTLQASELRESELRRESEELRKEVGALRGQSQQSVAEVRHLQTELEKATQSCSQRQSQVEELRAKTQSQESMLSELQEKLQAQHEGSLVLEKLRLAVADLEQQRDCSQDLLKKREHHIEQLNEKLGQAEQETQTLQRMLETKLAEREELAAERAMLSAWKSEKEPELQQLDVDRGALQAQVGHLEACLRAQQLKSHEYNERVSTLELQRDSLQAEVQGLRHALDSRDAEAEAQQQESKASAQKQHEEVEKQRSEAARLLEQVGDLERQLDTLSSEMRDRDQQYQDLLSDYESLQARLQARDAAEGPRHVPEGSLQGPAQPAMPSSSYSDVRGVGGGPLTSEDDGCYPAQAHPHHSDSASCVIALEAALESQKQMNSDLQRRCDELEHVRREMEENLSQAQRQHQSLMTETSQRISQLQEDAAGHQQAVADTLAALEDKEKELQRLSEALTAQQAETQEVRASKDLLEVSLLGLQRTSESLSSEKAEASAVLAQKAKEIEALSQENSSLRDTNTVLTQEKMRLLRESEDLFHGADEQEKCLSELASEHAQEKLVLLQRCDKANQALLDLGTQYQAAVTENVRLQGLWMESRQVCERQQAQLEQLRDSATSERQVCTTKLAEAEERSEGLQLELAAVQQELTTRMAEFQSQAEREVDSLKQEVQALQATLSLLEQENQQLRASQNPDPENSSLELAQQRKNHEETNFSASMQEAVMAAPLNDAEDLLDTTVPELETPQRPLQAGAELVPSQPAGALLHEGNSPGFEIHGGGQSAASPELVASPGADHALLQHSLRAALSQLAGLQQVCEGLQRDKAQLLSQLTSAQLQSVMASSRLAKEVEQPVHEAQGLNCVEGLLLSEEEGLGARKGDFLEGLPSASDVGSVSAHGKDRDAEAQKQNTQAQHHDAQVRKHLVELQERLALLQREHGLCHDQRDLLSSRLAELQRYVATLEVEGSVLHGDLAEEVAVGPRRGDGSFLSLSSWATTDSPGLPYVGTSFYRDVETTMGEETSFLGRLDWRISTELEESPGRVTAPSTQLKELQARCCRYEQSLRELEESVESRGALKDKAIEELERLLGAERRRHLSESEQWRQQLDRVTAHMETQLAAERKHTEHLVQELEAARLQLQGLDLSTRALRGISPGQASRASSKNQDPNDSEDTTPEANERASTPILPGLSQEGTQGDCSQESGVLQVENSREQTQDPSSKSPGEAHGYLVDPPGPPTSEPVEFSGHTAALDCLQLQLSQSVQENLGLRRALEEQDQELQGLHRQVQALETKLGSCEMQSATRTVACPDLKMEEPSAGHDPDTSLGQQAEGDKNGPGDSLDVDTDASSLEPITDSDWHKRFLTLEEELLDLRGQWDQAKGHVQSLEVKLACLHAEKLHLAEDNEDKMRIIAGLQEELTTLSEEKNRLLGVVDARGQGNPELGVPELVSRAGWEPPPGQLATAQPLPTSELSGCCPETLCAGDLQDDHPGTAGQSQLEVGGAQEPLAQALRAALAEKAEAASRLDCAQQELRQLRRGMERLRERIEADEQQRRRAKEQLQQSKRRGDALQDRAESLEHELQLAEEAQELAILDAEQAKAEAEVLRAQATELAGSRSTLEAELTARNERLLEAQRRASEMDARLSALEKLLEAKEKEKAQLEEEVRVAAATLQGDLSKFQEEMAALCVGPASPEVAEEAAGVQSENPQELGLQPLRESMAKLRARLEAEEQERRQALERLREGEHQVRQLQERVDSLERELEVTASLREQLRLDMERALADAAAMAAAKLDRIARRLTAVQDELVDTRMAKDSLATALKEQCECTSGLETRCASLETLLQEKEQEQAERTDEARAVAETLQARNEELEMEVATLRQAHEARVDSLENEKTRLLRGLEEAIAGRERDAEVAARKLAKKSEEMRTAQEQAVDQLAAQQRSWQEQEAERMEQLQSLQDALDTQQKAFRELQVELEAAQADKVALEQQVSTLMAKDAELQRERQEWEEKLRGEQDRLTQELRSAASEAQSCRGQMEALDLQVQELKDSLAHAHRELEEAADQRAQCQQQLQDAEQQHQSQLLGARLQHEQEMQACQEKLASGEEQLRSQTVELELLKDNEITLNQALQAATKSLEELKKKAQRDQQEREHGQGKVKLLIKSCRQLEAEKEALQKELGLLKGQLDQQQTDATGQSLEDLQSEVVDLRTALEEKGNEADQCLDKYCALLVDHEKLEKAKELLEIQLARLRAQHAQCPRLHGTPEDERPSQGSGKRRRSTRVTGSGGSATPATPETSRKRSRNNTPSGPCCPREPAGPEYELEGLPEVVKKGFADIPSGKTSPYVLRRTTMATRTSPRLAAQRAALSPPILDKENLAGTPKASTGSNLPPKAKVTPSNLKEPSLCTLAPNNLPERTSANSPRESLQAKCGRHTPSPRAPADPQTGENCRVQ